MAPLTPFWEQPSHGDRQQVVKGKEGFTSKSFSKISLPPFGLFADMSFPPCTKAEEPTYATVQMGRDAHLNLNSDLVYLNHSCDPSLILDMPTLSILAGPRGLHPGTELTFFYPSTEWSMAQPFDCFCGAPTCRGKIGGAKEMTPKQLEGLWLNGFIREMLEERRLYPTSQGRGKSHGNGNATPNEKTVSASHSIVDAHSRNSARSGPTSRELSGEMGGDTKTASFFSALGDLKG